MTFLWGKEGLSWLFYVPSFICGTLIGGSIAFAFLKKLAKGGQLEKLQDKLGSPVYHDKHSVPGTALSIAGIGVIGFVVIGLINSIFGMNSDILTYIARGSIVVGIAAALIYFIAATVKKRSGETKA